MKINVEVDISPQELQELFQGNMEMVQKAILDMLVKNSAKPSMPDNEMLNFWQSMAEKSAAMFEHYQRGYGGSDSQEKHGHDNRDE